MRLAKCSVVRLLLPFLLFICWHGHVQAATQVCGNIVGEHWSKANSPYLVTCDVRVATLTIDPGVWVLFQSNCVFEVDGTLLAVGTPDQPIVFTRTNGVGGWQGIYFNYCGPESVLVFCTISNSVNSGIRILGDSVSQIQNCTVANNITSKDGGGVWVNLTGSDQALKNCLIANNSAANAGGGIYANITPPHQMDIEGCVIAGNTATNPAVSDNAGGMLVYGSTLMRNCSLRTNLGIASGSAVYSEGGELAIYNCEFSGNEGGGGLGGVVYVFADSSLIVANCSFLGNVARTPNFATGIFVFGLAKTGGITNCTFAYNNQGRDGHGCTGGSPSCTGC